MYGNFFPLIKTSKNMTFIFALNDSDCAYKMSLRDIDFALFLVYFYFFLRNMQFVKHKLAAAHKKLFDLCADETSRSVISWNVRLIPQTESGCPSACSVPLYCKVKFQPHAPLSSRNITILFLKLYHFLMYFAKFTSEHSSGTCAHRPQAFQSLH